MVLSDEEQFEIICGKFQQLPKLSSKIIRMFISSTFTDTQCERNYLMEHVFPKLRTECQEKYGLAFQVVDMRWGIRDTAQDDHGTSDLCLKEIEICSRLSVGPSFMCLLGQRYGSRPLPTKMSVEHFALVRDTLVKQGTDVGQLEKWYLRDDNNDPPVYHLRPISSVFPGFVKGGQERNDILVNRWWSEKDILFNLLKEGFRRCQTDGTLTTEDCDEYFVSVTEQEVRAGIYNHPAADRSAICSIRRFENKDAILNHSKCKAYTDVMKNGKLDEEAQNLLKRLREEAIPSKLSPLNFIYCSARFLGEDGVSEATHVNYLQDFGEKVHQAVIRLVELDLMYADLFRDDNFMDEIVQHSSMCQKRCEVFKGRNAILRSMQLRLAAVEKLQKRSSVLVAERQPWVIHGESGSGKTTLMAKCASEVKNWIELAKPVVIIRFLGTTPSSCDIRQVLESVCRQICVAYEVGYTEQKSYNALVTYFNSLLKRGNKDRPLYLFLDSIDQLSSSNNAHRLLWLPRALPPSCHVIISLLPYKYDLLETAKQVIGSHHQFIEVTALKSAVCYEVLMDWLKVHNRTCTPEQTEIIKRAFQLCSLPLYVRFVFDEVKKWHSHTPLEKCQLETSVQGSIHALFRRLEDKYGTTLVSHTLGYLTASKTGLSDAEMNDILSLDDEVLNEVFSHWLPPMRRIPNVLWSRICADLDLYIVEREADGISVVFWYHRQFIEVAKQRYLSDAKKSVYLYSNMADYYRGVWAYGRKKPFAYNEYHVDMFKLPSADSEADRLVSEQPLRFTSGDKIFYNLRKLNHLPRLLSLCKKTDVLWKEILLNFDWLYSKISATSVQNVISDYSRLVKVKKEVKFIIGALSMAGTSLNRHPDGLSVELMGRLLTKSVVEASDFHFFNFMADVITNGVQHCALMPLHLSFDVPRSYQLYTLEGHIGHLIGMQFSPKTGALFTVSIDGTIASWDLRTGERISFTNVGTLELDVRTMLMFSKDGEFLICDTRTKLSPLLVLDPAIGQFVLELGERLMPPFINTSVAYRFVCRNGVIYDLVEGKEIGTLADLVSDQEWAKVYLDPKERYILVSNENNVLVIDILTFNIKGRLLGETKPSSIMVYNDVCIVGYTTDTILRFFDIGEGPGFGKCYSSLDYRNFVEGPVVEPSSFYHREVSDIVVSNGTDIFLANIQRCYLLVFDIELRNVKAMKSPEKEYGEDPCYSWACFSADDKLVLAVSQNRYLVLWNSSTGDNLANAEVYNGLFDIRYLTASPVNNVAATYSVDDITIKIWDLDKMQTDEATGSTDSVLRYGNSISSECLRVKGDYAFVKYFLPLVVERSYTSHFGISAIFMPKGKKTVILPFDRYGIPVDFDVSHNLKYLTLAVSVGDVSVLYFLTMKQCQLLWSVILARKLEKNSAIRFSAKDSYVTVKREDSFTVYDIVEGREVMNAEQISSAKMDPSETFVVGLQSDHTSMRAKLVRVQNNEFRSLNGNFSANDFFFANHADNILVTEEIGGKCKVHVYSLAKETTLKTFDDVIGGIADVTTNGFAFVDHGLNLFSIDGICQQLRSEITSDLQIDEVRITASGKYVYWVDVENTAIRCIDVKTSKEIAMCNLHSKIVGLELFGKGYQIACGCGDGRLVFLSFNKKWKSSTLAKIFKAAGKEIDTMVGRMFEAKIGPLCYEALAAIKAYTNSASELAFSRRRTSRSSDSGTDSARNAVASYRTSPVRKAVVSQCCALI